MRNFLSERSKDLCAWFMYHICFICCFIFFNEGPQLFVFLTRAHRGLFFNWGPTAVYFLTRTPQPFSYGKGQKKLTTAVWSLSCLVLVVCMWLSIVPLFLSAFRAVAVDWNVHNVIMIITRNKFVRFACLLCCPHTGPSIWAVYFFHRRFASSFWCSLRQ